jgi:multiple sugar transport system permease protein
VSTAETAVRPSTETRERPPKAGRAERHGRPAAAFLTPFLVLYLLFIIGPALYGLVMSFFNTSLVQSGLGSFAGFGNYAEALQNSDFWSSLWHTIWFTILTTPPLIVLAFVFALLADRASRGRWFWRLAFFMPFILPSAVVALIWIFIYTPELGLLTTGLAKIGIEAPVWLGDPNWAMISIAAATVWWTVGFNFVIYLAALQEIPREVHEAAALDGAGPWQRLRLIVVPMLGRATTLVAVLQLVASLKVFDQIYMMTNGGPDDATRPALLYVYQTGFTDGRVGYASTVALLLFVIILLISLVWFALIRRTEKEA